MHDDLQHHQYHSSWPAGMFDAADAEWADLEAANLPQYAILYEDNPKRLRSRWRNAKRRAGKVGWWDKPREFILGFLNPDAFIAHWRLERDGEYSVRPARVSDVEISYE